MILRERLKEKLLVEFLSDRDQELFNEIILTLTRQEKLLEQAKNLMTSHAKWLAEYERMR